MILETFIHFYEKFISEFLAQFRSAYHDIIRRPWLQSLLLIILSAVLLILSFPKYDIWILVWVALVPLMFALDDKRPLKAFGVAYLTGLLFFAGTLFWFVHVTILGAVLLILFLSLYFGLFGLGYAFFARENFLIKLVAYPSLWVVLEYLRGHLLTGFGWASLAHSQYKNLFFIQIAEITGMLGVSFFIVLVNYFLKEFIEAQRQQREGKSVNELSIAAVLLICIINFNLLYGFLKIKRVDKQSPVVYAAVIQGNVPLLMRWNKHAWPYIVDKYIKLTKQAIAKEPHLTDLIIWPETAYPGYLWKDKQLLDKVKRELEPYNIPLLFGSVTKRGEDYFNSAILATHQKLRPYRHYDKLHLVPFGEYIPFVKQLPFLKSIVPIDDFTAGDTFTVFQLSNKRNVASEEKIKFSVLVCFEDAVTRIARQFTQQGAQFLVNITNDAWFQDTKAPWMHVQSSVFRAIENRKTVVRAANTGVSCFIDPYGRTYSPVVNIIGKQTFVEGVTWGGIRLNNTVTFYARYGDVFTYLCFGCILWVIFLRKIKNKAI